jgi:hypothetical protein
LYALIERGVINDSDLDEAIKESGYWDDQGGCWVIEYYLKNYKQLGE